MCTDCWDEMGRPAIDTPKVREAARLVRELYQEHCTGGPLHIVVDDWNLEDGHVDYCGERCAPGIERRCYEALKAMNEDERASVLSLEDGWWISAAPAWVKEAK